MTKKDTRTDLVVELEKVTPVTPLITRMIEEAKAGEYHDFKNEKYICGKTALAGLLHEAGLHELRQKVIDGEYDEPADEEDKASMAEGMSPAMRKVFGF